MVLGIFQANYLPFQSLSLVGPPQTSCWGRSNTTDRDDDMFDDLILHKDIKDSFPYLVPKNNVAKRHATSFDDSALD